MPERSSWLPDIGHGRKRQRWALASLAAAMLILLAGIGGYFTFFDKSEQPAVIPAATQESIPNSDVPMYRGNPAHTGEMPGPGPDPARPVVERWSFYAGGAVYGSPAVVDGVAYVASFNRNVYALDAATGEQRWAFDAGGAVESSPAVVDGVVYVGSWDHNVYALDAASGEQHWSFTTGGAVDDTVVVDGIVYAGSEDSTLYALESAPAEATPSS
jgi:hypothetical protein